MTAIAIVLLVIGAGAAWAWYSLRRRELELEHRPRGAGISAIARSALGGLTTAYVGSITGGLSAAQQAAAS